MEGIYNLFDGIKGFITSEQVSYFINFAYSIAIIIFGIVLKLKNIKTKAENIKLSSENLEMLGALKQATSLAVETAETAKKAIEDVKNVQNNQNKALQIAFNNSNLNASAKDLVSQILAEVKEEAKKIVDEAPSFEPKEEVKKNEGFVRVH